MLDVLRVFCAADGSGGNPLGVFLDGGAVPAPERQAVAHELGFAETVFVDDRDGVRCGYSRPRSSCRSRGIPWWERPGCCASAALRSPCCARRPARCPFASTAS